MSVCSSTLVPGNTLLGCHFYEDFPNYERIYDNGTLIPVHRYSVDIFVIFWSFGNIGF